MIKTRARKGRKRRHERVERRKSVKGGFRLKTRHKRRGEEIRERRGTAERAIIEREAGVNKRDFERRRRDSR